MFDRGSRPAWPTLFLAVMLTLGLVSFTGLFGRWLSRGPNPTDGESVRSVPGSDGRGARSERVQGRRDGTVGILQGSRTGGAGLTPAGTSPLERFQQAILTWRRSTGPPRLVIDQVCLVPDVPSFFEAIAAWDQRHFFPILIDEPAWTLPFLRAFRPERVVRYAAREDGRTAPLSRLRSPSSSADRLALWQAAIDAVARAWSEPSPPDGKFPPGGSPPRWLGATPPGLVLTAPDSPMLAGAVALAAGRFQPLVRLEPSMWTLNDPHDPGRAYRFGDVLTLAQAWRFARRLEGRVASVIPHYDQLGDDCDFLTIAGDWPYRYDNDAERGPARGILALDDLIGRELPGEPDAHGLNASRRRWAYAGRLLGDPAASVARAMAALFLQPSSALLWDTYNAEPPWSSYSLVPAADRLSRSSTGSGEVFLRTGTRADLLSWHRTVDPLPRFGFIWINSSGTPRMFAITGGPGRPADVPGGFPAAVVMIHSFSAADPADPQTIAARWLAQGAFVFYGSVNEPYLLAFRRPQLVAELMAAEVPLAAALRQGELEPFGRPWRLIYLGDPLYQVRSARGADRLSSRAWEAMSPSYANWPALESAPPGSSLNPAQDVADAVLLKWCQDAAIGELVARHPPAGQIASIAEPQRLDWRSILRRIRRDRLDRARRPVYDDLWIDALGASGAFDEMQSRLALIPPDERRPRVWQALETGAMARLARLAQDGNSLQGFAPALDLWDEVIRLSWPAGSEFPAQLTERVSALAQADASQRMRPWLDRLHKAAADLAAEPGQTPHAKLLATERDRVEAKIGRNP
jgi:hypothetical protein